MLTRPANGPKRLKDNLSVLTAASLLRGSHSSIYNTLWQPFVLSLGATVPTLGLLNSLGGAVGLVATLSQALGGWFSDRLGRKPFIVTASIFMLAGYGLFAVGGLANAWIPVAVGAVLQGLAALSRPAMSSITSESARVRRQGSAFSLITFAFTAPGILLPLLAGWGADHAGYAPLFLVALLLEATSLILIVTRLRETGGDRNPVSRADSLQALVRSVVPPRGMVAFSLACAADMGSWGMGYGLLYGMLTDRYGFSPTELGLMSAAMSVSWAVVQLPVGRFMDGHRALTVMIVSEALGIPLMFVWMTQSGLEILLLAQVLMGLTAATWVPATSTYLARRTPGSQRAEAFGRLNTFRGLVSFPAPALGGMLYAWGGMVAPLTANLIGILVIIACLAACPPDDPAAG